MTYSCSGQVRALRGHSARVSALAWHGTTLSTGGRDSVVLNHDVRCARPARATPCMLRLTITGLLPIWLPCHLP